MDAWGIEGIKVKLTCVGLEKGKREQARGRKCESQPLGAGSNEPINVWTGAIEKGASTG